MEEFDSNVTESVVFPFLLEQLDLLITHKNGRRYNKQVLILAAEIFNGRHRLTECFAVLMFLFYQLNVLLESYC